MEKKDPTHFSELDPKNMKVRDARQASYEYIRQLVATALHQTQAVQSKSQDSSLPEEMWTGCVLYLPS